MGNFTNFVNFSKKMKNTKAVPRVFQDPKHVVWIKYFEKPSRIPKLPRAAPAELKSIFLQILHPTVTKKQIFAPQTQLNSDNEEYLMDLFELRSPISPGEINLTNYVKNHPNLLSKPFKILKVIGNSLVRTIIRFFTLVTNSLLQNESDSFTLSVFREDALNLLWIALHLPKPYKNDVRLICAQFFDVLPFPENSKNLIFDSQYFRFFEQHAFVDVFDIVKFNKIAKPFYVSAFGFLTRYSGIILDALGEKELEAEELTNVTSLGVEISKASIKFTSSIPSDDKVKYIAKILKMLSNVSCYRKSINSNEMVYTMGCSVMVALSNLLISDAMLNNVVIIDENAKGIIQFPIWCMDTFQHAKDLPLVGVEFEDEIIKKSEFLNYKFFTNSYSNEDLTFQKRPTVVDVLQKTVYSVLDDHTNRSLLLMMDNLELLHDTNIIDKLFISCQNCIDKYIAGDKSGYEGMNEDGRFAIIYTWFTAAYIVMHPVEWADLNNDIITSNCINLFCTRYIFDFCNTIPIDEHIPRAFVRREVFNACKIIYNSSPKNADAILSFVLESLTDSHLHICHSLFMFLYTLFTDNQEKFTSIINTELFAANCIWYAISIQNTPYIAQRNMFLEYLTLFLKNHKLCTFFGQVEQYVAVEFHFLFDTQLFRFFAKFIALNLLDVDEPFCFNVFCEIFHEFMQNIDGSVNDKHEMLTVLFDELFVVFKTKKKILREPVKNQTLITDIVKICKQVNGEGAQKLEYYIFKMLSIIVKGDEEFRAQLDRYHDDLYDQQLDAFKGTKCIPEILEVLWYFVFEISLMNIGNQESDVIKNPESLNLIHNITYNKASHTGFLSFIYEIEKSTFTNSFIISTSNFIETLINFMREKVVIDSPSLSVIKDIFMLHFEWDFQPKYFLQLINPHTSDMWLNTILDLLKGFIKPQNSNEVTNFVILSGNNDSIVTPNINLAPDSRGFTVAFTFRVDKLVNEFTVCDLVSSLDSEIIIGVQSGVLMYTSQGNAPIKTTKQIQEREWNNLAITFDGFDFFINVNGVQIIDHWETFKLGKDPYINLSIGANFDHSNPAYMSVASLHVFGNPFSNEDAVTITNLSPKQMQSGKTRDTLLINTPFKYINNRLINMASNKGKESTFTGQIITKTTIHTAVLKTNGILRLLKQVKTTEQLNKILDIYKLLITDNEKFEEKNNEIFPFDVLSAFLLSLPKEMITKDTISCLQSIWNSLANTEIKKIFFHDVWFSLNLWVNLKRSVAVESFQQIHSEIMIKNQSYTAELLTALDFLNIIACTDDSVKREELWKLLFIYFSVKVRKSDQEETVSFVNNAPEIYALELLLHLFGIINLTDQTSEIIYKFERENNIKLIFRFIYLLNNDVTKSIAASYITEEAWLKLKKAFLSLKSNSLLFTICVITSQFHNSKLLLDFVKQIVSMYNEKPIILARVLDNPLPEIWSFFILSRCSQRVIDFNENMLLTDFFTKIFHCSLNNDITFIDFFTSIFAFGAEKNADTTPLMRNIFTKFITGIVKNEKIDWKSLVKILFCYLFMIPKSDQYSMNTELLKIYGIQKQNCLAPRTPSNISILNIIDIFETNSNDKLFPLALNFRTDARANYPDLELASMLEQILKNMTTEDLNEKVFESLTIGHFVIYALGVMISTDANKTGNITILFENTFPPNTCTWSLFAPFVYFVYNAIASVTYWRSTLGRFCKKYTKFFGPYQAMVRDQDEYIIFNDSELNHFFIQQFGESAMYFTELLVRYTKHVEEHITNYRNDLNNKITELKKVTMKKNDTGVVYSKALLNMCFNQKSLYVLKQKLSVINAFDRSNLPCKIDKIPASNIEMQEPVVMYDNMFHPIGKSYDIPYYADLSLYPFGTKFPAKTFFINDNNSVVSLCDITVVNKTYKTLFYMDEKICYVGGFLVQMASVKFILQRTSTSIEIFVQFGIMILVSFPELQVEELIKIKPEIFSNPEISSPVSVFDHILLQNFINGRSFNEPDNKPIFPVVDENGIVDGYWSAEDYTMDMDKEKFKRIFNLESAKIHNVIHNWIFENLAKNANENIVFTDPTQQGSIFVNSFVLTDKKEVQSAAVVYEDDERIITEACECTSLATKETKPINVSRNSCFISLSEMMLYTNNTMKSICHFSTANEEESENKKNGDMQYIKSNEVVKFVSYVKSNCFAILKSFDQFSMFGKETIAQILEKSRKMIPMNVSTRNVIDADISVQLGEIAVLDERGMIFVGNVLRKSDDFSFLAEGTTKLLFFNSGCIVTLSGRKITSYTIRGEINSAFELEADVTCISKVEFDGFSDFVFCGLNNGSSLFLDAYVLTIAKVVNTPQNVTNAYFNIQSNKLVFVLGENEVLVSNIK